MTKYMTRTGQPEEGVTSAITGLFNLATIVMAALLGLLTVAATV